MTRVKYILAAMSRHMHWAALTAGAAVCFLLQGAAPAGQRPAFDVTEKTIPELGAAMRAGAITSRALVDAYLARIDAYDQRGPAINAIITLNPNARADADALDRERASRGPRGPLHGIPILLKDNYDTADLPTTAGSIALQGCGLNAMRFRCASCVRPAS